MRDPSFAATNSRTRSRFQLCTEMIMTSLTRFDPFGSVVGFDPFRNFDEFFYMPRLPVFRAASTEPEMKMELSEDDKTYYLKAEIPGVSKEDIHVGIDGNEVSITAE